MTYTSGLGVIEQKERFNIDMYIHAKTQKGALCAADRTLKSWGITYGTGTDASNDVDPNFNTSEDGYPQGSFLNLEYVDAGLYYLVVGIRKDELNPETISRLSHKAAKSRTEDDTIEMCDYITPAADLSEGIEKASRTHGPAVLIYSTCHDFRVCVYVSGVLISTHVCAAVVVSPESVKSNPSLDGAIYTGQIVKMAVGTPTNPVYIGECVGAVIDVRPDIDDSKKSEGVKE